MNFEKLAGETGFEKEDYLELIDFFSNVHVINYKQLPVTHNLESAIKVLTFKSKSPMKFSHLVEIYLFQNSPRAYLQSCFNASLTIHFDILLSYDIQIGTVPIF